MRNFWDEDPHGDNIMLWLCAIWFIGCCLVPVLS